MKLREGFELLATAPGGVARLRELILSLAVQGKLVPHDSNDEPASVLLKQIAKEKHHSESVRKGKRKTSAGRLAGQSEKRPLPQGWEWSSLAEIGVISPRNSADDNLLVSFVQMSSIPTALVSPHSVEERPWSAIKTGFTHFAEGDVGVAKITPCFENGKSTVFRNLTNGIGAGTTELHVVRPLGGISPDYVLIFLKTPEFLHNGEAVMTGSAGQKRLPRDYFENTPFPLPPLSEQTRIVAKVVELMRLCDELESRGRLEAEQHSRLTATLFEALAASESAHALAENWSRVAANFDLLLDRPEAVDALEQTILQLAVRGLLVPQDSSDEPASELVQKIRAEKVRLIAEGKIKRDKPAERITDEERPFDLPETWSWARLGDLVLKVADGPHFSPSYVDKASGVPFLSARNIRADGFLLDSVKYVSHDDHAAFSKRTSAAIGDILYTKGGTTGVAKVNDLDFDFSVWVHVAILNLPHPHVFPEYLALALNSPHCYAQSQRYTHGSTNKDLGLTRMVRITVPFPPLAEQQRIVARVEELRRLCKDLRARLTDCRPCQVHFAAALVEQTAAAGPDEGDLALAA